MKLERIHVKNLKACGSADLKLNGCSIIVTGANNSGKSSILKSLQERIQSKKPELIIKQGEKDGFIAWEL